MVELGRDGDLNFFKPRVGLVFHFPPSPLCSIGAHGKGRKERKTNSKDDSDGPSGDGAGLAAMQELLARLPRLSQGGASSNATFMDPEAYREQLPNLP
ncbi:hypothetical protein HAX54_046697 [Datura stramonium]|uniref:Uncharacterized protein n=1 Tax=Datura stramonium TaxID=4076 RepID=A0ABS8SS28_DATST|nr:hypothetical protein [Datura stramonium]